MLPVSRVRGLAVQSPLTLVSVLTRTRFDIDPAQTRTQRRDTCAPGLIDARLFTSSSFAALGNSEAVYTSCLRARLQGNCPCTSALQVGCTPILHSNMHSASLIAFALAAAVADARLTHDGVTMPPAHLLGQPSKFAVTIERDASYEPHMCARASDMPVSVCVIGGVSALLSCTSMRWPAGRWQLCPVLPVVHVPVSMVSHCHVPGNGLCVLFRPSEASGLP